MCRWPSDYHQSEVPGSEGPLEVNEIGDFGANAADGEGEGD